MRVRGVVEGLLGSDPQGSGKMSPPNWKNDPWRVLERSGEARTDGLHRRLRTIKLVARVRCLMLSHGCV